MLFQNHQMTMVTDLNMAAQQIQNIDFVTVAAVCLEQFNAPNIYDASILLPPTELLMRWADGDPYILQTEYPRYLMQNKDADDMIVAILAALAKKDIIMYIPDADYRVYGPILLNHIYVTYGIIMNTMTTRFSFDVTKLPFVISKFYMMDLMEANDYLQSYPGRYQLPKFVIPKLATELHPFDGQLTTIEQYENYFNQIVAGNQTNGLVSIAKVVDK